MTYHSENKIRKYVKGYGFLSFKNIGGNLLNEYNKYGKK